jgi:DNA repair exonuclease SbcCD ATPase subunit
LIYLRELRLTNHIVFKRLRWRLDSYPLTAIRGLNLDRGTSANAVGKSLLPNSIANLITDAPPISIKKHSARELVFDKSRLELDVDNGKVPWSLHQYAKGKTVKYDIFRNGLDQEIDGNIRKAREFIHQAVPLSEEQFYSQVLISSYRPPVLLYGRASARLDFFEEIFDLRIYDLMRKSLLQDLTKINTKFAQSELLDKQREEIQPQLKRNLSEAINEIRQRHKKLLRRYRELNEQAQQLIAYTTLAEQLSGDATLKELQRQQRRLDEQLKSANNKYIRLHRNFGEARNNRKILHTRNKLQRRLDKLPKIDKKYGKLTTFILRAEDRIDQQQSNIRTYLQYQKHIDKFRELIAFVNLKNSGDPDNLQRELTENQHSFKQYKSLRPGQPCPVCDQLVNSRHHKHKLNSLQRNSTNLSDKLKRAKRARFCRQMQARVSKKLLYDFNIGQAQTKLRDLERKYAKSRELSQILEQRRELINQLRQLPQVIKTKPLNRGKLRLLEHKISRMGQRKSTIRHDIKLLNKIADLGADYDNPRTAIRALRQVQQTIDKISPRLQLISDRMHKFTAQQSEYNAARRQLRDINNELIEIEAVINNKDIVAALVQAYSTKGIRLLQVQSLANTYITGLNSLSGSIYAEPVKFFAEVSPNQFPILAQRHGKIGDVRSLSGSESHQFMVISALAMIKLMPRHLRCSHIFLDEMESGLSPPDMRLFTQNFIPLLTNSIPHTVIITPTFDDEMPIMNAQELVLVRKNGISKWK